MSTKVIVIAVIAFLIIALGINFIGSQFKTISGAATEIQQEVKEQLMADLTESDDKLVLLERNINLERKKPANLIFGVNNHLEGELIYSVEVETTQKEQAGAEDFSDDLDFFYHPGPFFLEKIQSGMNLLKLEGKKKGRYLVRVTIFDQNEEEYADKSLFVEVN